MGARSSAPFLSGPGPFPAPWPRDLFAGCKAAEAWRWTPTPSSAEVKERVQLYLCTPSQSSWPLLWWYLLTPKWSIPNIFIHNIRSKRYTGYNSIIFEVVHSYRNAVFNYYFISVQFGICRFACFCGGPFEKLIVSMYGTLGFVIFVTRFRNLLASWTLKFIAFYLITFLNINFNLFTFTNVCRCLQDGPSFQVLLLKWWTYLSSPLYVTHHPPLSFSLLLSASSCRKGRDYVVVGVRTFS